MVMGGIVPVVNLEGVKPGDLMLDGATLAKIFLGQIKTWDDAAIKKLNPSAKLPSQADRGRPSLGRFRHHVQLHRLSLEGEPGLEDKSRIGDTAVEWPVGIGAKGNEGVANNVANTKGSIGYVEYAYAKQNKMTYRQDGQQGGQDRCRGL